VAKYFNISGENKRNSGVLTALTIMMRRNIFSAEWGAISFSSIRRVPMTTATNALMPADPPIAWNDIEALPIYAAIIMGAVFLWLIVTDLTPTLQAATLKSAGIIGCLALRNAWLELDDDRIAGS